MTHNEYQIHFSMWALVKSPLILGNDLTKMSKEDFSIISNRHIIAISQDPFIGQPVRIWSNQMEQGTLQLWKVELSDNQFAVAIINSSKQDIRTNIEFEDIFMDHVENRNESWEALDLWQNGASIGVFEGSLQDVMIVSHGIRVFRMIQSNKTDL